MSAYLRFDELRLIVFVPAGPRRIGASGDSACARELTALLLSPPGHSPSKRPVSGPQQGPRPHLQLTSPRNILSSPPAGLSRNLSP
jgi:hypothetical protein